MTKRQIITNLQNERALIVSLELPAETRQLIAAAKRRRNKLLLTAIGAGITEREAVEAAGVTRGLLWKIKKGLGR